MLIRVTSEELSSDDASGTTGLTDSERHKFLEQDSTIACLPEVVQFRQRLGLYPNATDEERARAIYDALVSEKRFKKTKDHTQNPKYSTAAVLRDTGGHCRTLSRAFASLCRAEGIPTREVTGALIGYPTDAGRFEAHNYCSGLFGHTWIEIHLHDKGWVPVEFHGVVVGHRAMTKNNVEDKTLRALIHDNTDRYFDYYFGNVDNQRLICSNSVKQIPQVLTEDPQYPMGDSRRWQPGYDLRYECALEVECI